MAAEWRDLRISRRRWLLAGLALPVSRAAGYLLADSLSLGVTWDGDNLHVSAPRLHFLTGKPLERLKDGASVVFLSQLTLFTDSRATVLRRVPDRLVLSYDLWEEKFSVTRLGVAGRTRSHLSADAAEAWCLESLLISASGLAPDRPFWLRFEMRTADAKELSSVVGEPGISITRLIEIFSRKPGPEEPRWMLDAGPLRLSELVRTPGRGSRNG
jgi:hypothetical protein